MLDTRFGIEVEFTGITRRKAAETVEKVLGGSVEHVGTVYDTYTVHALDGRDWKVMKDDFQQEAEQRLQEAEQRLRDKTRKRAREAKN